MYMGMQKSIEFHPKYYEIPQSSSCQGLDKQGTFENITLNGSNCPGYNKEACRVPEEKSTTKRDIKFNILLRSDQILKMMT